MPRSERGKPVVQNSFIASAAQITSSRRRGVPKQAATNSWQADAWAMLDEVGELEFFREWIANALSRCTLHVVEEYLDEKGKKAKRRVDAGAPVEALAALYDGEAGQPQMLAAMAGHIAIPGETWLVGLIEPSDQADGPDQWRVLSKDELKQEGSKWVIDRGDGEEERYEDGSREGVPAEALVIRIWRSHPRKWVEAHSSVRSALPILRQLVATGKRGAAEMDSRLFGNGLVLVPSEMTFHSTSPGQENPDDPMLDPFVRDLTEMMMAAYRDQGSADAMVPGVIKAPGAWLDKVKHLTFASNLSDKLSEREDRLISRLATSLDVPKEVLLGLADVNHWTGWLLDDNSIKMNVEPLLEVITHGITTRYLWPALQGPADRLDPALRRFSVEGDTSALKQQPNKAEAADAAHDKNIITDAAWARARGYDNTDLLSDPSNAGEYQRRLLEHVAGGVTTADLTAAALAALGVVITPKPSEVAPDPAAVGPGAPPPAELPAGPSAPDQGDGGPPAQPTAPPTPDTAPQAAALLLGSEAVVLRAMERAWNRVGRRGRGGRRPVEASQLEGCLADAWGYVPRIAAMTGVDEHRLLNTLETYTRTLLLTGTEHDPVAFAGMLRERVLAPPEALSA
jgi:hypothetical protein